MNPIDAYPKDWALYYDMTWMNHKTLGPGLIMVMPESQSTHEFIWNRNNQKQIVKDTDLSLFFPPCGAYNTDRGVIYLARRAARIMKKSAYYPDTYYLSYGFSGHNPSVVLDIILNSKYVSIEKALKIPPGQSIAVSRRLFFVRAKDKNETLMVFYRGKKIGTINDRQKCVLDVEVQYKKKYLREQLLKEGVECQN